MGVSQELDQCVCIQLYCLVEQYYGVSVQGYGVFFGYGLVFCYDLKSVQAEGVYKYGNVFVIQIGSLRDGDVIFYQYI